jgi:dihydrodipicolinate synthase/N-acetylneuraminate lyase
MINNNYSEYMNFNKPVYPLCPSFDKEDNFSIEVESTKKYIKFLSENGVNSIMTTAGTSQFNLLSVEETRKLNQCLSYFDGNKIVGIPPLSLQHIGEEIKYYNNYFSGLDNVFYLILFPERYYTNEQIIKYFKQIGRLSDFPILAHGNTLKKGYGGTYIYENGLLKGLSKIPKFIGIKEESPTIDFSIKEMSDLNLEIIVAGGSMRRFWCLEPFGATSYLSGVGSFFPSLEESFYEHYKKNEIVEAKNIMLNIEKPLFDVFMSIGWHASMRFTLQKMGFIKDNRDPFIEIGEKEKNKINHIIEKIKNYEDVYYRTV